MLLMRFELEKKKPYCKHCDQLSFKTFSILLTNKFIYYYSSIFMVVFQKYFDKKNSRNYAKNLQKNLFITFNGFVFNKVV